MAVKEVDDEVVAMREEKVKVLSTGEAGGTRDRIRSLRSRAEAEQCKKEKSNRSMHDKYQLIAK